MNNTNAIVLLRSKLCPPFKKKDEIERPRLSDAISSLFFYPLILVSAPTGYGKTTLLSTFFFQNREHCVWLSLDERDNDPVCFWKAFIASIGQIFPEVQPDLTLILPGMGIETLTGGLDIILNQLSTDYNSLILILDNFQHIENPAILNGLDYLIQHAPPQFHLVISTQKNPALSLNRLKTKNQLFEITTRDLAFSENEVYKLLKDQCFSENIDDLVTQIMAVSKGWPAGIRLLIHALQQSPDFHNSLNKSQEVAIDFLTEEVLHPLDRELTDFAKEVSVLDSFTSESATALTGRKNVQQIIRQMQESNLFLEQSGDQYQFHPFFREAVNRNRPADLTIMLHKKAADWYSATHDLDKAIQHALKAQDWLLGINLILQISKEKLCNGEIHTLESWLLAIPEEFRNQNFSLQVLLGWVWFILGKIPETMALFPVLEQTEPVGDSPDVGLWYGLQCQLALLHENNLLALKLAQKALEQIPQDLSFFRGLILHSLGSAQQALADSNGAIHAFTESVETNLYTGNKLIAIFSLVSLGLELNEQVRLSEARLVCEEKLDEIIPPEKQSDPLTGLVDLLFTRFYWETNELQEAEKFLSSSAMKLDQLGIPGFQISCEMIRVYLLMAQEKYSEALQLANRYRLRTQSQEYIGYHQIFSMLRAEIYLRMGRMADVANWLEKASLSSSPWDDPAREMEYLLRARYLLETGSLDDCEHQLQVLEIFGRKTSHLRLTAAILLTRAVLEWKKGDLGAVQHFLEESLTIVGSERYIRLFLDFGGPLMGLLAQLPKAPREIRYLFKPPGDKILSHTVEILTSRELDVLRLMAENCTNREIASTLVLSNETVKVHVKHIFQKLSVSDRRQAVRQARKLNLI
ncbi:LuxR C-terminal-related transcriptional regulator [Leptolinea tardivitalis]|uniref:HTH luxR-type domain-containing protein n=1 Tax=Leptolinea tardivitalis TaxID=229920 RepID=A0A0N8GKR2_9CHLR|nr:LuxR C-terminal-related transcriptional regulator [Leptolinea tardivitalis]KPL70410.1 hypothetical protein ADM99_14750 [Leptolinea tardivitalis]